MKKIKYSILLIVSSSIISQQVAYAMLTKPLINSQLQKAGATYGSQFANTLFNATPQATIPSQKTQTYNFTNKDNFTQQKQLNMPQFQTPSYNIAGFKPSQENKFKSLPPIDFNQEEIQPNVNIVTQLSPSQRNTLRKEFHNVTFSLPTAQQASEMQRSPFSMQKRNFHNYCKNCGIETSLDTYNREELDLQIQAAYQNIGRNENLRSIAIHEASHAVQAVLSTASIIKVATIRPLNKPPYSLGQVNHMNILSVLNSDTLRESFIKQVKIALAGVVGQQLLDRNFKYYSPDKMLEPNDVLNLLGHYMQTQPQLYESDNDNMIVTKNNYRGDVANIYNRMLKLNPEFFSEKNNNEKNQLFVTVVLAVYPELFQELLAVKEQIIAVTKLLLTYGTVSGDQILDCLEVPNPLSNPYHFNESGVFTTNPDLMLKDIYGTINPRIANSYSFGPKKQFQGLNKGFYTYDGTYEYRFDEQGNDVGELNGQYNEKGENINGYDSQGRYTGITESLSTEGGFSKLGLQK